MVKRAAMNDGVQRRLAGGLVVFLGSFPRKFTRWLKTIRCKKPSTIFSQAITIPKSPKFWIENHRGCRGILKSKQFDSILCRPV